jgi:hypothetical protein
MSVARVAVAAAHRSRLPAVHATGLLLAALACPRHSTAQVVFATDFENGLPAAISAPLAAIEPVQGYAGLGPAGRQFQGSFLRYASTTIQPTTLTLSNLPPHTCVDISFLLAIIDQWDGAERFEVRVDGQLLFSHSFYLYSSSYVAPPGGTLAINALLGFGPAYGDRAHDLGIEPVFRAIPHTAPTLTVEFTVDAPPGTGTTSWQGGNEESWAIDALRVSVSNPSALPYGSGCGTPALSAAPAPNSLPLCGSTMRTRITNSQTGWAQMALGFSNTHAGSVPLPLPLDGFGMPGCALLLDPFVLAQPCASIGTGLLEHSLAIPNRPQLAGIEAYLQAWSPVPGANPAGIVVSNGVRLRLDAHY